MKAGLYPKLAFDGIRKNKRLYLPYILTCIGMVTMYYIIEFLCYSGPIHNIPGAAVIQEMMGLGSWVIAIFACIFLFYTNSFLIRRRKKEFGLYNILGMGKLNLARIIFWETAIIGAVSLIVGLFAGILLSKSAELGLINMMQGDIEYSLSISPDSVIRTVFIFGVIFILLLLNSVRQIRSSTAISLIRSENVGEKPPKANWFFGILGIIILGGAYYIAVTATNPISALILFFVAVVMVIVGTYLIMIAGSVMFCRILQKSKGYYYRPNHFVSVSSMVYRMKRNGAGLASICILATMVLVMISSTSSLYFGNEDSLMSRFPREINSYFIMSDISGLSDEHVAVLRDEINSVADEYGAAPKNISEFRVAATAGIMRDGVVNLDISYFNGLDSTILAEGLFEFYFVPLDDYNRITGANETLSDGEAMIYMFRGEYDRDNVSFLNGRSFNIVKRAESFAIDGDTAASIMPTMYIFVPDLEKAVEGLDGLANYYGDPMLTRRWRYNFDTDLSGDEQMELTAKIWAHMKEMGNDEYGLLGRGIDSRESNRQEFLHLFGGLFYLGIMLSIVFIFAAVLIIYYKQISEGYEDQARFEIMQKIGMTKREIRRSINSQLLTVFFLPLVFAGMHLLFAFPIIRRILLMFNLNNAALFALTTVICFAVFALLYTFIYRITSNAYYNIVSGAKEERI